MYCHTNVKIQRQLKLMYILAIIILQQHDNLTPSFPHPPNPEKADEHMVTVSTLLKTEHKRQSINSVHFKLAMHRLLDSLVV